MAADATREFCFILAPPRSGTTLLARVLSHVDRTRVLVGGIILPVMPSLYSSLRAKSPDHEYCHAIQHSFAGELSRVASRGERLTYLLRLLRREVGLREMLPGLLGRERTKRLIYKEPFLSFAPELVLEAVEDPKIIYLVRDGRDVAHSLVTTYNVLSDEDLRTCESNENPLRIASVNGIYPPWWVRDGLRERFGCISQFARAALMWEAMMLRLEDAVGENGRANPNVLHLCYESFAKDPGKEVDRICAFFGERSNNRLRRAAKEVHASSVGRYKNRSTREIAEAEVLIGETLQRFNYVR